MSASKDLRAWASDLRGLSGLPELAAKRAAPLVEAEAKRTAAAGTDPYGTPWPPKKNGERPLANAAEHVTAHAAGTFISIDLEGPDVFHQDGAQGKPVRRVIPDVEIPDGIAAAVARGCDQAFDELTGAA